MRRVDDQRRHAVADGLLHRRPAVRQRRLHRRLEGRDRRQRVAAAVADAQQRDRRLVQRRLEPGLLGRRARRRTTGFPNPPYTTLATTPGQPREAVPVRRRGRHATRSACPSAQRELGGITWASGRRPGRTIPLRDFFVAKPGDSAQEINARSRAGSTCCFTPGVYDIDRSIDGQAAGHRRARPRPRHAHRRSTARSR